MPRASASECGLNEREGLQWVTVGPEVGRPERPLFGSRQTCMVSGQTAFWAAARHATTVAALRLAPEPDRDRQLEPRSRVWPRSAARLGTGQRASRAQAAWGVRS